MEWLMLALLASIMWSASNLIDKFLLEKWLKNPLLSLNVFFFVGIVFGSAIFLWKGIAPMSGGNIVLILMAGTISSLSAVFYFKALSIEEVSRIVPLFNLSPLFILLMAAVFLGEVFAPAKYLGIAMLVTGSVLITLKKTESKRKFHWGKSMWLMLGSLVCGAIVQVITKYLLGFADYWSIFGYLRLSGSLALIPLVLMNWKELIIITRKHGKRVIAAISASEITASVALLIFTLAVSLGPVTLVNSVGALQPLFVLAFAVMFSRFFPHILKEEIDRHTVAFKVLAIVLMIAGTALVA